MTKLDKALKGITLLGFDTSPFIYFVERHPTYLDVSREIIRRVDSGVLLGYSSVITLTEVLVQPKKFKDSALENDYRTVLQHSRNFELVLIDESVAEQAADLRSRYTVIRSAPLTLYRFPPPFLPDVRHLSPTINA